MRIPGIDLTDLRGSLVQQPYLVQATSLAASHAELALRTATRTVDAAKAALHLAVRKNPGEYGLVKPTESDVEAVTLSDGPIKALQDAELARQLDLNICVADYKAVLSRGKALSDLVALAYAKIGNDPNNPE